MHGVRDIALFSCKLYALYFGATLQAQVTTATIGQFPRQTNAVTPGVAAFAFQQFFAVFANFARNTIAFGPSTGNITQRPQEIVMAVAKKAPNPIDRHVGSRVRMRRMMLAMSQEKLGDALGLTFQQVQKYEKGTNRIAASRLQQMSHILQVPVAFFFEGAPNTSAPRDSNESALSVVQIDDFISDSDGLRLIGAFMRIDNAAVRRRIVMLVQEIAVDTSISRTISSA